MVAACEIAALDHEAGDDAMELAAFVVQLLALLALALLTGAQRAEVLCGLRHNIVEELEDDLACLCAADLDVKKNLDRAREQEVRATFTNTPPSTHLHHRTPKTEIDCTSQKRYQRVARIFFVLCVWYYGAAFRRTVDVLILIRFQFTAAVTGTVRAWSTKRATWGDTPARLQGSVCLRLLPP